MIDPNHIGDGDVSNRCLPESDREAMLRRLKEDVEARRHQKAESLPPIVSFADHSKARSASPAEVVCGVLYRGAKMLVAGQSKGRKTYLLCDFGICVTQGLSWLGFETRPCPVVYLNFEMQDFALEQRLDEICENRGISRPADLHLWQLRGHGATIDFIHERLATFSKENGVGLIIIDPVYKLLAGLSENNAEQIAGLLGQLDMLARDTGAAVAFSHHFAKGAAGARESIDRASGTGVWARDPDAMLTLTPLRNEGCVAVEAHLRNFPPVEPFGLRWDHPIWVRDDDLDPNDVKRSPLQRAKKSFDLIMDHLPEEGVIERSKLIDRVTEFESVGKRWVEEGIKALLNENRLHKSKRKRPGCRDEVSYSRLLQSEVSDTG